MAFAASEYEIADIGVRDCFACPYIVSQLLFTYRYSIYTTVVMHYASTITNLSRLYCASSSERALCLVGKESEVGAKAIRIDLPHTPLILFVQID